MGTEAHILNAGRRWLDAVLAGTLTEAQAMHQHADPETLVMALLAASRRIAEQGSLIDQLRSPTSISSTTATTTGATLDPSTPSGMQPVYTKANTPKSKRRRKPGAKTGHQGCSRPAPLKIDHHVKHAPLKCCPCCGETVEPPRQYRKRTIEDIPHDARVEATEHEVPRQWCGKCKKHVEPIVTDALPKCKLGHRVSILTAWFHYGLGITIGQVIDILQHHLHTRLSGGGMSATWQRLARIFEPWYEQIEKQAKNSSFLHADETGWRVDGQTHWLWCFTNPKNAYYMIDRSRGSPALQKFFTEAFEGVLVTDFWRAYESVCADERQYCLVHLLREIEKVDQRNDSDEWRAFAKQLRRLLRDGMRLRKRADYDRGRYESRVLRINTRLNALADEDYIDADTDRLAKRLRRHRDYLFTFLDYPDVPAENNFAERQIRPAVIMRKNSQSNRSGKGAATQAILMSVHRTLKLRGLPPIETMIDALKVYMATGQLPPLPDVAVAGG